MIAILPVREKLENHVSAVIFLPQSVYSSSENVHEVVFLGQHLS